MGVPAVLELQDIGHVKVLKSLIPETGGAIAEFPQAGRKKR